MRRPGVALILCTLHTGTCHSYAHLLSAVLRDWRFFYCPNRELHNVSKRQWPKRTGWAMAATLVACGLIFLALLWYATITIAPGYFGWW